MTSLERLASALFTGLLALAIGCGGDDDGAPLEPPAEPYVRGISGGMRDGVLEVIGIDEETGALLDALEVELEGSDRTASGPGWVRFEGAPDGPLRVLASSPGRVPQRWYGVEGARAVLALPESTPAMRRIEGVVSGLDSAGVASVWVGPLAPPRLLRTSGLDAAMPVECATDVDGTCRFEITVPEDVGTLIATLRDEAGHAIGFAQRALDASDAVEIALTDVDVRVETVRLSPGTPQPPPTSLDAVIGVPGLLSNSRISVLSQLPGDDGTLAAPALTGTLSGASWWMMHEARRSAGDGSARSVVLVRGLRSADAEIELPAFLELPEASFEDGLLRVVATTTNGLVVVDWLDGYGATIASDLAIARLEPWLVEARSSRARVRMIEAYGIRGDAMDLDGIEPTISRFAQVDVAP